MWYNPKSIANILSLALIIENDRVTFDSRGEHDFYLWMDESTHMKFKKSHQLFMYHHSKQDIPVPSDWKFSLLQTVKENKHMYRPREFKSAKAARDLSKNSFFIQINPD